MSRVADPTEEFFGEFAARGHEPILGRVTGTIRFDLTEDRHVRHWYVTIEKGDVTVSHKNAKADAVLRSGRLLFDEIVAGRENAFAALLRGAVLPEGDLALLDFFFFERAFRGASTPPTEATAGDARRMK